MTVAAEAVADDGDDATHVARIQDATVAAPVAAEPDLESVYWDASTMAPLSATSSAAVARLRAFTPPDFPLWDRLPVRRRAAVLMLLYPDRRGRLRLVITMRSASLRNFPSEAALPGGKADSVEETAYTTARREAWEEIGLPATDDEIPPPFRIELLCFLPHHLARTDVVVRPCVALLRAADPAGTAPGPSAALAPRPDSREVAAVFSAPFEHFLSIVGRGGADVQTDVDPDVDTDVETPPGHWYDGSWMTLRGMPWRVHNFYVPVDRQTVARSKAAAGAVVSASAAGTVAGDADADGAEEPARYRVWGLTARMLVEAARIGYDRDPEQEHNSHYGDEDMIVKTSRNWELVGGEEARI